MFEQMCPADIAQNNDPGLCGAVVNYATPPGNQTGGLASGSLFPVGKTTNTFSGPDCSFTVTVNDVEKPKYGENVGPILAEYYTGINFNAYKYSETVPSIFYNWFAGSPNAPVLGNDYFSIRYTSTFTPSNTGTYNFRAVTDDGFRLYINNVLVMNHWVLQDNPSYDQNVDLVAGQTVPVRLEFFENESHAEVALYYTVPGSAEQTFGTKKGIIGDQVKNTDPGVCTYTVIGSEFDPAFGDNCSAVLTNDFNDLATLAGAEFEKGTTPVEWKATDASGNVSTFVFEVTVNDEEPPVAVCQPLTVQLEQDGTFTITASQLDGGSTDNCPDIEFAASKVEFDCTDVGPNSVTLTVTDAAGNTDQCATVVTVIERPATLTYTGDVDGQYSDAVTLSATLVDDVSGEGIEGKTVIFTIGTQTVTVETDEDGLATVSMVLTQDPCEEFEVLAEFEHDCPYLASSDTETFDITPEDVEVEYVGVMFQATPSATSYTATVKLMATIREVDDGSIGDISKALVSFVNRDGGVIAGCIPVEYFVDPSDPTTGIVTFNWLVTIPTNDNSVVTQLGILAGVGCESCFYQHNDTEDDEIIVVYQPEGDFITGGGYIMPEYSAGPFASDPDSKANFGFNVKYTKKGNKLQGKMTIIIRQGEKVYQVKSNAITSLATNVTVPNARIGVFTSKADLKDVTDELNPVTLQGNLILKVTMTDRGEPGIADAIGITLWSSKKVGEVWVADKLLYSCNWTGMKTLEETLVGGNLVVHCGANINVDTTPVVNPGGKKMASIDTNSLNIYPNPFSERLHFEFVSQSDVHARIDLYDVTGRMVKTVFDQAVEARQVNHAEFIPAAYVSGMYLYRITLGNEVFNGKVMYKK